MSDVKNQTLLGSWVVAAGTIASAINASLIAHTGVKGQSLNLIGNTLQATGNGITASSPSLSSFSKTGNLIQSAGNSTIIYSILTDLDRQDDDVLIIKGNLLQALGGIISFSETYGKIPSLTNAYQLNGEALEVIGNSIQSVAARRELKGVEANDLSALGSWIQAIGAIIVALALTKTELISKNKDT